MYILFFMSVYLGASIQEWFFHKYLMHKPSFAIFEQLYRNHKAHHTNTKSDYSIVNNNPEYICFEILSLDGIIQTFIVFFINTTGYYMMFYPSISFTMVSITVAALLFINIIVWNTYHAHVHGFDASVICNPPGFQIDESSFVSKWYIQNHEAHHDNKNTNYNIVFPGADFLFGTYQSKSYTNIEIIQ